MSCRQGPGWAGDCGGKPKAQIRPQCTGQLLDSHSPKFCPHHPGPHLLSHGPWWLDELGWCAACAHIDTPHVLL